MDPHFLLIISQKGDRKVSEDLLCLSAAFRSLQTSVPWNPGFYLVTQHLQILNHPIFFLVFFRNGVDGVSDHPASLNDVTSRPAPVEKMVVWAGIRVAKSQEQNTGRLLRLGKYFVYPASKFSELIDRSPVWQPAPNTTVEIHIKVYEVGWRFTREFSRLQRDYRTSSISQLLAYSAHHWNR